MTAGPAENATIEQTVERFVHLVRELAPALTAAERRELARMLAALAGAVEGE